jgi:putative Holliday junction resolvase
MQPFSVSQFQKKLPESGRLLAIDHGKKRIGLALSDVSRQFVNPLETLSHPKFSVNLAALEALIEEHQIIGIVIGYPLNMDGSEGPRCQSVRQFTRNLEAAINLPMLLWDERLSSQIAQEQMLAGELRAAKRGAKVDKLAAAAILQSYLEEYP